ncbi:MAG: hypothetical protein GX442_06285 [Candidatus Riflebacteria bacterium]|nr:hypothetical protein [Candidatus Riflebacteria bacterium]
MVRPLYPRPKNKPEATPETPWWKNPSLLLAGLGVLSLVLVTVFHFGASGRAIDPTATPATRKDDGGWFSFLRPSKLFRPKNIQVIEAEEWANLDLGSGPVEAVAGLKAENFREKRRLYAFQKYEAARQLAREKEDEKAEFYRRRSTPTAQNLREALAALEDSDNLGIMKLETLLNNELLKSGGKSENLDILIFAFQNLGDSYVRKNMKKQAKDAYLNAFRLIKEKAPSEEGANWDGVIAEVEKLDATTPGN